MPRTKYELAEDLFLRLVTSASVNTHNDDNSFVSEPRQLPQVALDQLAKYAIQAANAWDEALAADKDPTVHEKLRGLGKFSCGYCKYEGYVTQGKNYVHCPDCGSV